MIATGLVFALGALVASLVALLAIPLVWRKAQALARRDFDATIPTTANELRAEIDRARAEAAFAVRRGEIAAREAREGAARERAEAGRIVMENGDLLAAQKRQSAETREADARIAALETALAERTTERDKLAEKRERMRHDRQLRAEEMEALAQKYRALGERADEQRLRIAAAETRIASLTDQLRAARAGRPGAPERAAPAASSPQPAGETPDDLPSVAAAGTNRLRAAIADKARRNRASLDSETARRERAEIREELSDIAARVIHMKVQEDGAQSPLARMIETAGPAGDDHVPTLADRVRRLMREGGEPEPAPEPRKTEPAP